MHLFQVLVLVLFFRTFRCLLEHTGSPEISVSSIHKSQHIPIGHYMRGFASPQHYQEVLKFVNKRVSEPLGTLCLCSLDFFCHVLLICTSHWITVYLEIYKIAFPVLFCQSLNPMLGLGRKLLGRCKQYKSMRLMFLLPFYVLFYFYH